MLPMLSSITKSIQQRSPQTEVETIHWVKVFATKTDDLNLISRIHLVEGMNQLPLVVLRPPPVCCGMYIHIHTYTHKDPHRDFVTESSSLGNHWFGQSEPRILVNEGRPLMLSYQLQPVSQPGYRAKVRE